jgi:hypothetical protein
MEKLDERSRDILQQRWLNDDKATLHEMAARYNVSAERIQAAGTERDEKIASRDGFIIVWTSIRNKRLRPLFLFLQPAHRVSGVRRDYCLATCFCAFASIPCASRSSA